MPEPVTFEVGQEVARWNVRARHPGEGFFPTSSYCTIRRVWKFFELPEGRYVALDDGECFPEASHRAYGIVPVVTEGHRRAAREASPRWGGASPG
jgi:hypothetical protein